MEETQAEQIDLRGLSCPTPVIRTKQLLDKTQVSKIEALVDDEVCVNNLKRLAVSTKCQSSVEKMDGYFSVTLEKQQGAKAAETAAHQYAHAGIQASVAQGVTGTGTVLFLGKDLFGQGDPEFSRTLMNLFLQTTLASGLRPRAILMANTGVKLLAPDAQTLQVLDDFRKAGCEVLACGLCVEFYGLKGKIPQEQITSMFAICEFLFAADRIIQP